MNSTKLQKTLLVTIAISVSSQISFNLFTDGFIVALSPLVMGIFIYCYWELTGLYIAWLAAIFSPLFRLVVTGIGQGFSQSVFLAVVPDIFYFLMYGTLYWLISKAILKGERKPVGFFLTILCCDFGGNICELLVRSAFEGTLLIHKDVILSLALIATIRTIIIEVVIVAVDSYSSFLVNRERNEMFEKLLGQASVFEGELRLMEKNVKEIEGVMKKAYDLHMADASEMSEETRRKVLDIAKNSHEIKGDYLNVINTLKDIFSNELADETLKFSEIINLERRNLLGTARTKGYVVSVSVKIKGDFEVRDPFKLMSVVRNLLTNAFESFKKKDGKIQITGESDGMGHYLLTVKDNGCGIEESNMEFVTMDGYSTKFDQKTGNIQRGLGIPVVKDIIENDYDGQIIIESTVNKGTEVTLIMSEERLGTKLGENA